MRTVVDGFQCQIPLLAAVVARVVAQKQSRDVAPFTFMRLNASSRLPESSAFDTST